MNTLKPKTLHLLSVQSWRSTGMVQFPPQHEKQHSLLLQDVEMFNIVLCFLWQCMVWIHWLLPGRNTRGALEQTNETQSCETCQGQTEMSQRLSHPPTPSSPTPAGNEVPASHVVPWPQEKAFWNKIGTPPSGIKILFQGTGLVTLSRHQFPEATSCHHNHLSLAPCPRVQYWYRCCIRSVVNFQNPKWPIL